MLGALRQCVAMLSPSMRRRWLLLVPLAIAAGLMEAGAAAGIYAFILVLTQPDGALPPRLAPYISALPFQSHTTIVVQCAVLLGLFYVVKSLLVIRVHYVRIRVISSARAQLASAMFRRYLSAPYPFHFHRNSADLIRACTTVVQESVGALDAATIFVSELLMAAGVIVVLVKTSSLAAFATAALIVVVTAAIGRLTRRNALAYGRADHELEASILQSLQQSFGAIKEIKVLGRERFFDLEFVERQDRRRWLAGMWITLSNTPAVILQTVLICGALLLVTVLTISGRPGATILAVAGVFGYASMRLIPTAQNGISTLVVIRTHAHALAALYRDFTALPDVTFGDDDSETRGATAFTHTIELRDVSYAYPGTDEPALRHVSLTIPRGQSVGIVGPTGSGKSTLADIILGLLAPTAGTIAIDGREIVPATAHWRRRVGYVPQALFLIDDTLRRNIALGVPDADIDHSRLREVLEIAQLSSFVRDLPLGLDTVAGERGVRLSGGERQRIAIARALYHDPDLLVFDEATSSLDVRTEAGVAATIDALRGVKTMIVIAHRLSTVRSCDTLVWLRDGRVAAHGSFEDLKRLNSEFREFAAFAAI